MFSYNYFENISTNILKNWITNNIKRKINKKQKLLNIYFKSKTELDLYNY